MARKTSAAKSRAKTSAAKPRPEAQSAIPVVLAGTRIDARVAGAMSEIRIAQSFRNAEDEPIEAVYSFPLPSGAVLLDVGVEIGDRRLTGDVVALDAARETYEDAVAQGNGAFLLEQTEPGIFTLNAGNLLPGETARVSYAFATLNRWSGDRLRFVLPTTIAPRYGVWNAAPHAVPETSLIAENRCALRIALAADLRASRVACPSHPVRMLADDGERVLVLADETAAMDRDIVVEIRHRDPRPSFALLGEGGDGVVALASFQPFLPGFAGDTALDAVAIIDCSGSMAGTSIDQARKAMRAVLASLRPQDRLGLIAFGSATVCLDGGRLQATPSGLAALGAFADRLDATLGGTEIGTALDAAVAMAASPATGRKPDLFLVTDGEVANWQALVARARDAGHRIFAVGVGHAVAEPFLSGLALATGGAAEFVTPDEGMAERVARHFERMRAPRATDVSIAWPEGAVPLAPALPPAIFDGDTVHAFARLGAAAHPGCVALDFATADGARHRQEIELDGAIAAGADGVPSTLARLAAAAQLAGLTAAEATRVALAHRLLCDGTAWVVVDIREAAERTDGMPALRKVPHMLAAGWGGSASVCSPDVAFDAIRTESLSELALFAEAPSPGPVTPRDSVLALLAATARPPAPGEIARAAGRADEYAQLCQAADGPFLADLVGMAFEAGILAALGGGDHDIDAARARFEAEVEQGLDRLHALQAQALHGLAAIASLLPAIRGSFHHAEAAIRDALQRVAHARALGSRMRHPDRP
jgi:Ca-activated chloride channel family protein